MLVHPALCFPHPSQGPTDADQDAQSQAIVSHQGTVYCSGQLPMDATGRMIEGSVRDKTRQCLSNLRAVLQNAGSELDSVMKINVRIRVLAFASPLDRDGACCHADGQGADLPLGHERLCRGQ